MRQLGRGLREVIVQVARKDSFLNHIVDAIGIMNTKSLARAVMDFQAVKLIVRTLGPRDVRPAFGLALNPLRQKHAIMPALVDGKIEKLIAEGIAHEYSQIISGKA